MKYSVECVSYKHYPTFREVTSKLADYDSFDEAVETAVGKQVAVSDACIMFVPPVCFSFLRPLGPSLIHTEGTLRRSTGFVSQFVRPEQSEAFSSRVSFSRMSVYFLSIFSISFVNKYKLIQINNTKKQKKFQ